MARHGRHYIARVTHRSRPIPAPAPAGATLRRLLIGVGLMLVFALEVFNF